ncbi:MAG: 1,4-dihydroxy-2-naphthoate polyprenyltransferase [Chloroflexi bacterium]|nr:MAG: 1,4-dihydroxy-2-naphthoate polyprenyltransferase [Chloroflexota bacterium]
MVKNSVRDPKSEIRNWALAARPKTLPAALAPVVVGTALAYRDGAFSALPALAAAVGALLIQIGVNLANDYFDYVKGVDTSDRVGPTRVTQSGLIPPEQVRRGMLITFGLAAAVGLYLVAVGGWPILVIGVASIVSAVAYTGGPYPLGSHGLGDLFVFLFFGLAAVAGTYYVQALTLTPVAMVSAVPMGTLATAILVVNNLRDIETDRRAGKRTLAVMIGERATRLEYVFLLAVAYVTPLWLWLGGHGPAWVLLPWASLPLAVRVTRMITRGTRGPALNVALARTAQLELVFGLLFAAGLVL